MATAFFWPTSTIVHKDKSYPGEHAAIVDQGLWDKVQKMLASNLVTPWKT